jgi:hypothetical protein
MISTRSVYERDPKVTLALVLAALVLLGAGFLAGQHVAEQQLVDDREQLRQEHRRQMEEIKQTLEVAHTRNQVDKAALDLLRQEIAEHKERIVTLEEGLRFYKGLMAPENIDQGVRLRDFELVGLESPGQFAFSLVTQQEARKHELVKGELRADLYGVADGEEVTYSLAELSDDVDEEAITLRFRYFQTIEGVLELPSGFVPSEIRVRATLRSPQKKEIGTDYVWRVKKRFTHVGK